MAKKGKKVKKETFKSVFGTRDIFGEDILPWHELEDTVRSVMNLFNYTEIRTPTFEKTELFSRSIGHETDIVGKEMYTFEDRDGESLTLRPEGTAPVVRAFIQHYMIQKAPVTKLFYISPMYRRERPQKGRFRQFHQFGAEVIGSAEAWADVEVMAIFNRICERLGIECTFKINSIGCPECRPVHRELLVTFLEANRAGLCKLCLERMVKNPLRVFDCKNETCRVTLRSAPIVLDHLCFECRENFSEVRHLLDDLDISYEVDSQIVRGFDYYTRTAFEVLSELLGAQSAFMGGGRYDGLVEELGGESVPAVGFAAGMERMLLILEQIRKDRVKTAGPFIYVACEAEPLRREAFKTVNLLRNAGISADGDLLGRSLKAQMKSAGRSGAEYAVIFREEEKAGKIVILRNLNTGHQKEFSPSDVVKTIRKIKVDI